MRIFAVFDNVILSLSVGARYLILTNVINFFDGRHIVYYFIIVYSKERVNKTTIG